jgi:hypothetical protein
MRRRVRAPARRRVAQFNERQRACARAQIKLDIIFKILRKMNSCDKIKEIVKMNKAIIKMWIK